MIDFLLHVLVLFGIYTALAISLDLVAGHTGLLSMAHGAFYGLGAYTSALLAVKWGVPFPISVLIGMVSAMLFSFVVSIPSLRLHDDYFVIATFGFQIIVFNIFNNFIAITRGPLGIPGIPRPDFFGWKLESRLGFVVLAGVIAIFSYWISKRISESPFGRVLHAIREDEIFATALGKNVFKFKVIVFAVSGSLAASAGSLYAHYITFIDPTSFTVTESIIIVSMVIFGGAGSRWGPLIGAIVLVSLPELLRFLALPSSVAANVRQGIYGASLVIMMTLHPQGLLGRMRFRAR